MGAVVFLIIIPVFSAGSLMVRLFITAKNAKGRERKWIGFREFWRFSRFIKKSPCLCGYFIGSFFITAKDAKSAKEGMDKDLLRALRVLRGLV
jgi:hypothetical protein